MSYETFQKLLGRRVVDGKPLTPTKVLEMAGVPRSHGLQVLMGKRLGPETRPAIAEHLTIDEIDELGWEKPRGLTRVTAGGKFNFVATLEYNASDPGSNALVDCFLSGVNQLHRLNQTDSSETRRVD